MTPRFLAPRLTLLAAGWMTAAAAVAPAQAAGPGDPIASPAGTARPAGEATRSTSPMSTAPLAPPKPEHAGPAAGAPPVTHGPAGAPAASPPARALLREADQALAMKRDASARNRLERAATALLNAWQGGAHGLEAALAAITDARSDLAAGRRDAARRDVARAMAALDGAAAR